MTAGRMSAEMSPPLAALVGQVRAATGDETPVPAPALDADGWAAFADLAIRRHLVGPLVATRRPALEALGAPGEVLDALAESRRANTLAAAVQIAETKRIAAALALAEIEPAVVKGWPLAQRFYPGVEARHVGDLDLLVAPDEAARAVACLEALGFAITSDAENRRYRGLADPGRAPRLLATGKHVELVRETTGMVIELHWRLMSLSGWPEIVAGALVRQETEAGPIRVPGDRANLVYLSVHGALHAWDRLKWLADIAVLARARGPAALAGDLAWAGDHRLARPLALALSLSHRLLGSPLPEGGIAPALRRRIAPLEARLLARLAGSGSDWDQRRYSADIRRLRLGLAEGWAQRLGVLDYDTLRRLRRAGLALFSARR